MMGRRLLMVPMAVTMFAMSAPRHAGAQDTPIPTYLRADTSGLQVSLLGVQAATRRELLTGPAYSSSTVTLRGAEAIISGGSAGIMARYLDGSTPTGGLRAVDARLLLGDARSAFEIGVVQRTMPERRDTTLTLARVGLRLYYDIGGSGASVHLGAGGAYAPQANADTTDGARKNELGWDAEALFRYRLSRWNIPAQAMIGYRMSVVRMARSDEELGMVLLGLGLSLSGR